MRGSGGGGLGSLGGKGALGAGGGIVGIIAVVLVLLLNGGGGGGTNLLDLGAGSGAGTDAGADLSAECQTGEDANQQQDCRIVAVVNTVQDYWGDTIHGYQPSTDDVLHRSGEHRVRYRVVRGRTVLLPARSRGVRRSRLLRRARDAVRRARWSVRGGVRDRARVRASRAEPARRQSRQARDGSTGPTSSSVRLELQADCYAGVWASNAVDTEFIEQLTDDDIARGLDAAAAVGDDRIQQQAQGQVNPEAWTHGSSEQRQRWFTTGYNTGDPTDCDTFAVSSL